MTSAKIKAHAVKTPKIADGAVNGQKVATDSLTGANIDESTLGQVPDAAQLDGKGSSAFVAIQIYSPNPRSARAPPSATAPST